MFALLHSLGMFIVDSFKSRRRLERRQRSISPGSQLSSVAKQAKAALGAEKLDAVADRGYFNGEEILACEKADITATLRKPMTSPERSIYLVAEESVRIDSDCCFCPMMGSWAFIHPQLAV